MARLKIYTDENVDVRIADGLRKRGIRAFSADHHFLEIAKELNNEGKDHWGVIFVEMNKLSVGECIRRLALYADILSAEEMKNQIEFL
ncbi:MAG: hypothetical protein AB1606_06905 [Nitrospirota bacterium]